MADVFSDEMLEPYVVSATWDELPSALLSRYDGVADRILSYLHEDAWPTSPELAERWATVANAVHSAGHTR
jgi:hypothetical protein